jgi:hypothetical protein
MGTALLDQVDISPGVRLLGISVSNLIRGAARQLTLDMADAANAPGPAGGRGSDAGWDAGRDQAVAGATPSVGVPSAAAGWEEAARAVDQVRHRFGDAAIGPAVLLGDQGLRVKRQGDTQWGPDAEGPPAGRDLDPEHDPGR